MSVVVLNHSVIRDHIASIHREGCSAIEREKLNHGSSIYGPFDTVEIALADYLDEDMLDLGYSERDVRVHACAR